MIKLITIVLSLIAVSVVYFVYTSPIDHRSLNRVCSPEVKKAIYKMGPGKDYRLFPNGRLEVLVNGKWLKLRYEER